MHRVNLSAFEVYDRFLADVLRGERMAFGFVAHPAYKADLPGELVWLLIRALVREKGLTLNRAARVVLDFTERNSEQISCFLADESFIGNTAGADAAEMRQRTYEH